MNAFRPTVLLYTALTFFYGLPVLAEDAGENAGFLTPKLVNPTTSEPGRVIAPKTAVRKIASTPRTQSIRTRARRDGGESSGDTDIRLFLFGGLSNLGTSNSLVQNQRDEEKIGSNIIGGLGADIRFKKYFGIELDTYYGFSGTTTVKDEALTTATEKKIQHLGAMIGGKVQYPTYIGSSKFTPKLGFGYATLTLKQHTQEVQPVGITADVSQNYKGIYGTVGFDIEPVSWLIISADYARSITSSGTFSGTSNVANEETPMNETSFDRIRAGALFRVYPNIYIGGDYIRRSLSYSEVQLLGRAIGSQIDFASQETLSQIAAKILFKF